MHTYSYTYMHCILYVYDDCNENAIVIIYYLTTYYYDYTWVNVTILLVEVSTLELFLKELGIITYG